MGNHWSNLQKSTKNVLCLYSTCCTLKLHTFSAIKVQFYPKSIFFSNVNSHLLRQWWSCDQHCLHDKQLYWSRCWRGSRSSSLALWLTRNATLVFGLFVDVLFDIPLTKLPVGPVVWCGWFNLPFRWQRNWQSDFWDRFERHKYNIGAIAAFEYAIATELIILFWTQKIEYESP